MKIYRATLLGGLLAIGLGLSGCKGGNAPETQQSAAATQGAAATGPDAKPGITFGGARMVLPVIPGRPGVAYFRVANNTDEAVALAGVHLASVGKAEMHRTSGGKMAAVDKIEIASGAALTFAPGGYHVMAFDIADTLKSGGQTEVTLTFADGDKISAPVEVEAMGDATDMGASH